ncbi:MAG: RNB domain-containing ribonuclease [Planctomycetota bacterium]|nr:MAG: RNB domain-containing ribonuclease [Planctomycetota bacterium]
MLRKRSAETTPAWRAALIQYIAAHPDRPLKARALAREIGVPNDAYAEYRALVRDMLEEGALVLGPGRTLRLPETADTFRGVFRANRRGFGFIECPGRPDVFVPRHATGNALDGDTVEARQLRGRRRDDAPRAQIVRVVERAPTNWVGVLERLGPHWIVRPHGKAPAPVVHIADPTAKGARPGELVVVEPIDTRLNARSVRGVIVERLGPPTKTRVKTTAVARRFGLPTEFSEEVRTAAHACVAAFDPKDRRGREDLTNLLTITIDPPDARDFDDAISIAPREGGLVELGVHIADVSAFVRPGSPLDEEARRRGNSTYFPGHVVPMLPEVLSNGLCSLQPGEPRLTKSAFIVYDRQANVVDTRLANSVIRSRARLTYDEVTSFLEGKGTKPPARGYDFPFAA